MFIRNSIPIEAKMYTLCKKQFYLNRPNDTGTKKKISLCITNTQKVFLKQLIIFSNNTVICL